MPFALALLVAFVATTGVARADSAPTAPAGVPAAAAALVESPLQEIGLLQLPATICGLPVPAPSQAPPAGSPPLTYLMLLCFEKQGGQPVIEAQTYLYYIELKNHVSIPSQNRWVPYTEQTEQIVLGDFKRLWATNFLDDLSMEVRDVALGNGVTGKVLIYNMEERQRIRIVDYVGSDKVDQSKIEEELKKRGINLRIDSFIDPGVVRRVSGIVREMYAEKGYQFAEVKPTIREVAGGPKLVHLTFNISEGPKVRIRDVEFVGNKAVSDRRLEAQMKENKSKSWLSFITGGGTFKEDKFEDDADKIIEYYRDRGYITAAVGQPDMKILEDENDGRTRWVQLVIPISEGNRYRIGKFDFAGNTIVPAESLRTLFKLDEGDTYSEKKIRKGLEKAREVYGAGGYYEFTAYPDLSPRDRPAAPDDETGPPAPVSGKPGPPIVDVTMRVQEGKQYFVHRITFEGNTTTRDNVIRRELRLVEGGVFNTEGLKYSIRRLNQLGYFKPLEGDAISVDKTSGAENQVDVRLKFEEQNRNQLTFGAGVSQFEGFFGTLSFQTSNFLGRGETFTITAQQGSRAKNYQLAFTEPFLFDRPMTVGVDLFNREFEYIGLYTQASAGGNLVYGFQVQDFGRMFINYSLEQIKVKDLNPAFNDPRVTQGNPLLQESLLLGAGGRRTVSKIGPTYVYNTIDHPIFPTTGKRLTAQLDFAGIGGNTKFVNPRIEGIAYFQHTRRTSFGVRAQGEYITPYGSTLALPIFEKLFMGGEYSIRGFDLRTVGPRDPVSGIVIGGNKSLLFNAEYLINIAGPVRLVLFADAGQVRDAGENFMWKEPVYEYFYPEPPGVTLTDPFAPLGINLRPENAVDPVIQRRKIGELSAFKSSIGAEIRFFMPVLNVPFRLIFAMNPSRGGVLSNQLIPESKWKFRFAVGSTF
ncbi:MAG TPA: BamA/TamA family outer membrane protein [Vicinamibacterales bacterium]|nr:BamA/TamA family outer membrane protein [Vicinamibacterales bacterium]